MKILSIDLETYSSVDLGKSGVYKYAESEDFEILLFAYSIDDGEVKVIDLASGEIIPEEILSALSDESIEKWAFNANFERVCLSRFLGKRLKPQGWYCTMIWSAYLGLPLSLEKVGEVLKLDKQKMNEGKALIRYFSIPCKPTKTNGMRTRNLPHHDLEKWSTFKEYNQRDVETEMEIKKKLSAFPMPQSEWENYWIDQNINDRGILIDEVLVDSAIKFDEILREENMDRAIELTGLENPNSPLQLKGWLNKKGLEIDSLAKKDVESALKNTEGDIKEVLELRQELSKSSVRKYDAMKNVKGKDNRARGLIQFYGANRTGRYSGRLIQVQNLRRNNLKDLDLARSLIKNRDYETMEILYESPSDILSQLIRTAFIAKEGTRFIISDFSAIEARVLAWLAGEQWVLDAFENGEDIYCRTASRMFGVPVEKHGVNGHLRQKGKIATLACIAEGELVLTDKGLVPIENLTKAHKLWDGENWVLHDGVIYKGIGEVIEYDGLRATKDHIVWIEGQEKPIQFGEAAASGAHLLQSGDGRRAIRVGEDYKSRKKMGEKLEFLLCPNKMSRMWKHSMARQGKFNDRKIKGVSSLFPTKTNSTMVGQKANSSKAKVYQPKRSRIQKLWRKRNKIQVSFNSRGRSLFNRKIWIAKKRTRNRQNRQQWALRKRQLKICNSYRECFEQEKYCINRISSKILALCTKCCYKETFKRIKPRRNYRRCRISCIREKKKLERYRGKTRLYDIRNAGKNNRFTVSGKLVHNCGYQGALGALKAMGGIEMGLSEDELQSIVDSWREANPNIVSLWWDIDSVVKRVVKTRSKEKYKSLVISYEKGILFIELPSKRRLAYPKAKIGTNRFGGESIVYEGIVVGNKWDKIESYGGKFVENIVQAIARDILAEAMMRLEKKGFNIVMHIHDEVVIESDSSSIEEINEIMSLVPSWAPGLILDADGFESEFYKKD
ncbi:DNA polymerase [Anaerococcus sp. Marseille-P9784]|uniref:DNA polymerase n=1 Tax=Anaerococcus sp. Marseille-P9784 TaxID=2614127 RepID=UPI00124A900C|nr:DNA polymerase [Anaerococcus sp. Marseille-P9784]